VRKKPAVLLDVSDSPAQCYGWLLANTSVADSDFSTQRLDEAIEATKQRRLARSTFTDERNSAPGWNVDADIIQRGNRPEAM
jgi:hypothetical protein